MKFEDFTKEELRKKIEKVFDDNYPDETYPLTELTNLMYDAYNDGYLMGINDLMGIGKLYK